MYYLGVDLGTTAVKMLIMNEQGKVERIVSRDYPLYLGDNGHSEQDPKDWWEAVKDGVKALVSGFAPDQIRAVSFSGQMHGLVMLDEKDEPIRRAILWNDQRTQAQCDELHKTPGRDALIGYTANVALTGFTAPKLLWVKENEPELFAKITKVMLPKDYISYCLSGVFATDYSDASGTLLLDVQNKRWSAPMLEIVGLTENQLPKLYASYEAVGTVRPAIAKELGLSSETKVVIGGGVSLAFSLFEAPLKEALWARLYRAANPNLEVVPTALGYDGGLLGAASVGFCLNEQRYYTFFG